MREYICDLCKRRIEPKDIRMEHKFKIEGKEETMDFHSLCFCLFLRELQDTAKEGELDE